MFKITTFANAAMRVLIANSSQVVMVLARLPDELEPPRLAAFRVLLFGTRGETRDREHQCARVVAQAEAIAYLTPQRSALAGKVAAAQTLNL
jgi:hypothetical protein